MTNGTGIFDIWSFILGLAHLVLSILAGTVTLITLMSTGRRCFVPLADEGPQECQ